MKDAPAFDFYPERWTHGTRHMSKVDRCDYLDLLLHQWTEDGLPSDPDKLAPLVGYKKGSQISPAVLEKFPLWVDGKRRNNRMEHERQKQRDRILESGFRQSVNSWKRWHKNEPLPPHLLSIEAYQIHCNGISHGNPTAYPMGIPRVSPPLTTHHSPLVVAPATTKATSPPDGGSYPTMEEAKAYAEGQGQRIIKSEWVEKWWLDRNRKGWCYDTRSGNQVPIADWYSDLQFYAKSWQDTEDKQASKEREKERRAREKKKPVEEAVNGIPVIEELPPSDVENPFPALFAETADRRRKHEEWLATPHDPDEPSPYL